MSERDIDHEAGEFLRRIGPPIQVPRPKTRDGWKCSKCFNYEPTNTSGRADYADFTVGNERRSRICIEVKATKGGQRFFAGAEWEQHQRQWAADWQLETRGSVWIWLQMGEDQPNKKLDKYWKLATVDQADFDYRIQTEAAGKDSKDVIMPRRVLLVPAFYLEQLLVSSTQNYGLPAEAIFYGAYPRMKKAAEIAVINGGLTPDGLLKEFELTRVTGGWWPPASHIFWRVYYHGVQQQWIAAQDDQPGG